MNNSEQSIRALARELAQSERVLQDSGSAVNFTDARKILESRFPNQLLTISTSLSSARREAGVKGPGRGSGPRRRVTLRARAQQLAEAEKLLQNRGTQLDPTLAREILDIEFPGRSSLSISSRLSSARREAGVKGPGSGSGSRRRNPWQQGPKTR